MEILKEQLTTHQPYLLLPCINPHYSLRLAWMGADVKDLNMLYINGLFNKILLATTLPPVAGVPSCPRGSPRVLSCHLVSCPGNRMVAGWGVMAWQLESACVLLTRGMPPSGGCVVRITHIITHLT